MFCEKAGHNKIGGNEETANRFVFNFLLYKKSGELECGFVVRSSLTTQFCCIML